MATQKYLSAEEQGKRRQCRWWERWWRLSAPAHASALNGAAEVEAASKSEARAAFKKSLGLRRLPPGCVVKEVIGGR